LTSVSKESILEAARLARSSLCCIFIHHTIQKINEIKKRWKCIIFDKMNQVELNNSSRRLNI
jgi:hypothetical protein